jgi:hypothetical protein
MFAAAGRVIDPLRTEPLLENNHANENDEPYPLQTLRFSAPNRSSRLVDHHVQVAHANEIVEEGAQGADAATVDAVVAMA